MSKDTIEARIAWQGRITLTYSLAGINLTKPIVYGAQC